MALIIPEVYASLTREKFEGKVKVANLATNLGYLSNTTVGDTVTFPKFKTLSDVEEMVKGTALVPDSLEQTSSQATIKQFGKATRIFDMDNITAFGNQVQEAATQHGILFARNLDLGLIEEALTSPLVEGTANANAITATEIMKGLNLFGDERDTDDFAGIVVNSLLADSFYSMNEFVSREKTYTTDGNGVVRNGVIGYFLNIPVYLADHSKGEIGTYNSVTGGCQTFIIKKNSLAYMTKRDINIELEREAKLKATDVVADFIYATKLVNDNGVVVLKQTV